MRRLIATTTIALATLTGCVPGWIPGTTGWHQAQGPNRVPVVVADVPQLDNDQIALGPINETAGWPIYVAQANTGSNPDPATAQVEFLGLASAGMAQIGCPGVPACTIVVPGRNGALVKSYVFYDADGDVEWFVWLHELVHALGFEGDTPCSDPYRGFLSYCGFWYDRSAWGGTQDVQMFTQGGYR